MMGYLKFFHPPPPTFRLREPQSHHGPRPWTPFLSPGSQPAARLTGNFIPLGGGLPRVVPTGAFLCQLLQGSHRWTFWGAEWVSPHWAEPHLGAFVGRNPSKQPPDWVGEAAVRARVLEPT